MWHLVRSELIRFRALAIAFAIAHLVILRLSMVLYPLFAADAAKTSLGVLSCSLLGLNFGLYQMGTYRRPNLWSWLVHRPLPVREIFAGLTLAAALLCLAVVVVPVLLMTLYADLLSAQWVDLRHYLMMPFLFGLVMAFYFVGCFIVTSSSRGAFLVAVLPIFFLTREAVGQWVLLPMVIVLIWLAWLARSAFKPELGSPVKRPSALVASALPVAYATFWALVLGVLLVRSMAIIVAEEGPGGLATFAWNDYWDEGHLPHVEYLDETAALAHGLRLAGTERSRFLLQQVPLADVFELVGPRFSRYPVRHQPFFSDQRHELIDEQNDTWWTFSHDQMLFRGRHRLTGRLVGWMGPDGPVEGELGVVAVRRFTEVPYVVEHRFLVTSRQIFELDLRRQQLDLRFELPPGERVVTPFVGHRSFVIVQSDRALYFFEPRHLDLGEGMLEPLHSVALPGEERNISRVLVAELLDSYLVSFVLGSQSSRGHHPARQVVAELQIGGGSEIVADLELAPGFPDWYRHRGFVLSPLLQHGHDLVWTAIGPHREQRVTWHDITSRPVPAPVAALALLLAALSAAGGWWLASWRHLEAGERRFWTALTFLLGVPGLVAFGVLAARNEAAGTDRVESSARALAVGQLSGREGWSA